MSSHNSTTEHTVLSGHYNPSDFNSKAPLVLFIIQLVIIMGTTRLLNVLLSRVQQPRVISEIIGGIILGPSVLGRIPGFQDKLFPKDSLSYLNLVANFGLVLYLFLVGLEVDPKMITRNAKVALSISGAGILLPFATGIAVSYGLYEINEPKKDHEVPFSSFLLFMGAAMSITAFPVLARIVTELKLLRSYVGSTVLCAAVGDDVAAWVLLALVISILNSTNSLVAVYIILCVIGWTLVLYYLVRPLLLKLIKKTGSNVTGPTVTMMSVTLLVVFASAFVTDIVGVHAIFGGFLVGLMIPHEGGFAVGITEKIEDLINILFLPIYFALSGLKTEISLLNTGAAWGYIFLVIFVAMAGKLVGCTLAARYWRFEWREAATVGIFMSCKGLVELIVLNIGLDAGVIDKRVFAIMVMMAIVTTCATTPLAIWAYPPWYQKEAEARRNRRGDVEHHTKGSEVSSLSTIDQDTSNRILVVLNKIDYVPSIMTLIQLLQPQSSRRPSADDDYAALSQQPSASPLTVHALRLMDLGQRIAPVIRFAESKETLLHDPITNIVRTFGHLNFFNVKASLAVVPFTKFSEQVAESTQQANVDMVIAPWAGRGSIKDVWQDDDVVEASIPTPSFHEDTSPQVANYMQGVFAEARAKVVVLVDRGLGVLPGLASVKRIHGVGIKVFFPFFGGLNDRAALELVVRLSEHPRVTVNILRINKSHEPTSYDVKLSPSNTIATDSPFDGSKENSEVKQPPMARKLSDGSMREQLYSTRERLASNEADELLLVQYFNSNSGTLHSHPRVSYNELTSSTPLQTSVDRAMESLTTKDLVVIGRTHRDAPGGQREEWLNVLMGLGGGGGFGNETRKSLGELAESMIVSGVKASILVVQGLKEKRD